MDADAKTMRIMFLFFIGTPSYVVLRWAVTYPRHAEAAAAALANVPGYRAVRAKIFVAPSYRAIQARVLSLWPC